MLIETPSSTSALADRIISTLPSSCCFHSDLGLSDTDVISGAQSGRRLGTKFKGWARGKPDYIHAYSPCGAPIGGVPFHQLWLRHAEEFGLPSFDSFSPAAQLARHGRESLVASQPFGLQLTPTRYREMMRAYALHLGVSARAAELVDVELRTDSGFIDTAVLAGGHRVAADLYVDCTGASSLFQRRLNTVFLDWSAWLLCDRVLLKQADPIVGSIAVDQVSALPYGWSWTASSPQVASIGAVYSSGHAEPSEGSIIRDQAADPIVIAQGRRRDFWVRNCVAIGDSAVTVEPLEWTNLHLVQSQLDRLVEMMPGRECAGVEIAQFNIECAAEADRVRDFLCLHYVCSARPEPFWREAASVAPPPELEHTLALFKERGRLPYYQEQTFTRDSWLTVLLGQGVRPRRVDPLADLVSSGEAEQAFAAMRQSLQSYFLPAAGCPASLNPHGNR